VVDGDAGVVDVDLEVPDASLVGEPRLVDDRDRQPADSAPPTSSRQ
jgi:hypothetical protein